MVYYRLSKRWPGLNQSNPRGLSSFPRRVRSQPINLRRFGSRKWGPKTWIFLLQHIGSKLRVMITTKNVTQTYPNRNVRTKTTTSNQLNKKPSPPAETDQETLISWTFNSSSKLWYKEGHPRSRQVATFVKGTDSCRTCTDGRNRRHLAKAMKRKVG